MNRRALPARGRRLLPVAAGMTTALLLAGCGGGPQDSPRPGAAEDPAEAMENPRPGDQSAPGAAAASYFDAVGQARFDDACALLAPVVVNRYASAGKDCATELAALFDETTRAAIGDVTADEGQIQVVGSTATVPGAALTRTDAPSGADGPSFPTVRATRQQGLWYLLP